MLIVKPATIAAAALALMALVAALAQIPFDAVAGSVLIAEVAATATIAAAAIARRAGRQRWTPETRNDHNDRLPVPRVDAKIVEPQVQVQRPQIAAPQMEVSQWHSGE